MTALDERQSKLAGVYRRNFPTLTEEEAAGLAASVPEDDTEAAGRAYEQARRTHLGRAITLPEPAPLTVGSERQKAAAEQVRKKALGAIRSKLEQLENTVANARGDRGVTPELLARLEAKKEPLADAAAKLAAVRDAGWWLDHRHNDFASMRPEILADLLKKAKAPAPLPAGESPGPEVGRAPRA